MRRPTDVTPHSSKLNTLPSRVRPFWTARRVEAVRSLRHRPLLWMAPAVVAGCALGPSLADWSRMPDRSAPLLLCPLLPALVALSLSLRWMNRRRDAARVALACALFLFCASQAARRALPPPEDVSRLVRQAPDRMAPQNPVGIEMQGFVASFPQRGEFGQGFAFECERILTPGMQQLRGRVWVAAPLSLRLEIGDGVALRGELRGLPRAGNPGERTDGNRFVEAGCWCLMRVNDGGLRIVQPGAKADTMRVVAGARSALLAHYEAAFGVVPEAAGVAPSWPYARATAQLLCAMVFGEGGLREPLPRLTRDQFRAAGLSHLLVASGAQVSFLTIYLLLLARWCGLRRWPLLGFVVPILVFYAILAGGEASIWRATIGGTLAALALLCGRDVDALSLWCLALGVLLLLDPFGLWDLGLQLTFAATWGLLVLSPPLRGWLARLSGTQNPEEDDQTALWNAMGVGTVRVGRTLLLDVLSLSLAAQLATLPLLLLHFGRLSASGLGANLVAVPLSGVLLGTGVLGLLLPMAPLNYGLTHLVGHVASLAASLPGAQAETLPVRPVPALLFYILLLGFGLLSPRPTTTLDASPRRFQAAPRPRWQGVFTGAVVMLAIWAVWRMWPRPPLLRVVVLDVGQGESIVVMSPTGHAVLVDGGTLGGEGRADVGAGVIVPFLQSAGVRRLDAILVTHADADHLSALPAVLREVPCNLLIDGARPGSSSPEYEELLRAAKWRGVPRLAAKAGQRLDLGSGATVTLLSPPVPPLKGDNDNAVAARVQLGRTSVLLTADIEAAGEARLVQRGAPLACTILKLAHHGSKTSTSEPFLRATRPRAAILSCGRYNPFGHPAPVVLKRLQQAHIPVFRTDIDGAVEADCDGQECWIQTYR